MAFEDLAGQVRDRRARDRMSLRAAAAEAGVGFNTLARIERGHVPDTQTLSRVIAWLGLSPETILGEPDVRREATPDVVARHLRTDPALSKEAAERIAGIVSDLYRNFARPPVHVHLRAAPTFVPQAGRLLAEVLTEIGQALEQLK